MVLKKANFLDIELNICTVDEAVEYLLGSKALQPGYICFPSSDTIAIANKNSVLKQSFNEAELTLPDGKVTEWLLKLKGHKSAKAVSSYDILKELLSTDQCSHFFYGPHDETLQNLEMKITGEFPKAKVLGYLSPPMLHPDKIKEDPQVLKDVIHINSLKPDFVWIGISSPKQDLLMNCFIQKLDGGRMLGVGAAILYLSGEIKRSPAWIKKLGLRWLYRMLLEPKRLIPFVVPNLILFLKLIVKDLFGKNKSAKPESSS
ncbi:MAG: WecB/TagA/CpsF family glycosyltransferase [Bacteroidales bacterium]|nr:WecB/TagA/CpsF family glycosyltransferase [Bacteroidales bacterium]